jgi:hypothetical protein
MTEEQLKAFPAFRALPVYDESDARSDFLTKPPAGFRRIHECATLDEVLRCLKQTQFVPLGGLRATTSDGPVVVAYFGEKK